jgi:hypothetical protein
MGIINIKFTIDIEVEVDVNNKSIYSFINRKQCPYYISDIPSSSFPLLFAIREFHTSSIVEVSSLQVPIKPSYDFSVNCEKIVWEKFFYQ